MAASVPCCLVCGDPVVDPGPAGGHCARGHFTPRGQDLRLGSPATPVIAPPPPPLPLASFPPVMADYIADVATAIGCHPDYVAAALIAGAAAAIGNRVVFPIKPGLTARAIVWLISIGHPGVGKTPGADAALSGHRKRQNTYAETYRAELATWEKKPVKERGTEPRMARLMVSDTTLEALARALVSSSGILCSPGELTAWFNSLSRYRREGSDRPEWLKLWSGQPIDQERLGRAATYVKQPHVCLFGEIQPDRIPVLTREASNDGLPDRFLVVWPDAEPLPLSDRAMPDDRPVVDLVANLTGIPSPALAGAWLVSPTRDAFDRYREWHDDENLTAIRDGVGAGRGWAAKAPMHVQRLALILHMLWTGNGYAPVETLTLETMERAIALVETFRLHQERLIRALSAGAVAKPRVRPLQDRILTVLRRKDRWLSATELVAYVRTATMLELKPVLADLIAAGVVETQTVPTKTKPSQQWRATSVDHDSPFSDSANSANLEFPHISAENGAANDLQSLEFAEVGPSANSKPLNGHGGGNLASNRAESRFAEASAVSHDLPASCVAPRGCTAVGLCEGLRCANGGIS